MNKPILLLLCCLIGSINAMNFAMNFFTKYTFKNPENNHLTIKYTDDLEIKFLEKTKINYFEHIPLELITGHMFPITKLDIGLIALIKKFGLKGNCDDQENECAEYYQHIIKPLIMLACTNKTFKEQLSLYLKESTYVSCNNIFKYIQRKNACVFIKQHLPINIIDNTIVACPSNIKITDRIPLLDFSISLYNNALSKNSYVTFKFNIDFANCGRDNKNLMINHLIPYIVHEVNAYRVNELSHSPSIIHSLLNEHQLFFDNLQKNYEFITCSDKFSIFHKVECDFHNDDEKIPLTSLNFKIEKLFTPSN